MSNIPVMDSSNFDYEVDVFANRYSIYCHDPFKYNPVNFELIEQLAIELKAQNPQIVENRKGSIHLTADSFDTIQDLITQKEEVEDFLAVAYEAYLLEINSSLFYKGYPMLFWTDYPFVDSKIKDYWGQVSFQRPFKN